MKEKQYLKNIFLIGKFNKKLNTYNLKNAENV